MILFFHRGTLRGIFVTSIICTGLAAVGTTVGAPVDNRWRVLQLDVDIRSPSGAWNIDTAREPAVEPSREVAALVWTTCLLVSLCEARPIEYMVENLELQTSRPGYHCCKTAPGNREPSYGGVG